MSDGPAFIGLYATEEENADREVRVILDSEVVISVTVKDGAPAEAYVFDRKSETMLAERDLIEREAEIRKSLPERPPTKTIHVYGPPEGPDVRLVCPWGEGSGRIPPPIVSFLRAEGPPVVCSFRRTLRE